MSMPKTTNGATNVNNATKAPYKPQIKQKAKVP